ncbi:MAG: carbohydrate binding family 9 domain-containing protein [Chlorobi bacterium]|nr:carbohydrate binding family 9 domain-containing protein [Chlorobiota bacterium]
MFHRFFTPILFLVFLNTSFPGYSQTSFPDTLQAYFTDEKIVMDGRLDEGCWQQAMKISNFTQRELNEGHPATEKTIVKILYNNKTLYIGVWCYDDEPDKIEARQLERDFDPGTDDNFGLVIDTYGDKRNGYLFITNPNGARLDAMVIDNGRSINPDWDGVWMVKTKKTKEGWFAEFEIPFSTLRFRMHRQQSWGINFERNIRRKREQDAWQGWSRDGKLTQISRAGTLVGIAGISKTSLIELKPYAITGRSWNNENQDKINAGGDVNYLITPTMKLNLTINTDFAQVESDRMQVNLTRFSLYYPEKREFFLEGKNYFDFGLGYSIQPFYSRRIGLAPDRTVTPILSGVRLMGKAGNTTLGGMSIQTARKDTIPTTNFSVLRWKQDIGSNVTVGVIGVNKAESGRDNMVYGADFYYSNSHIKGDKNLIFGGALSQSYTSDSLHKTGMAHRIFIEYPNDNIDFSAIWDRSGESFNPETGFLRRKNYQMINADMHIKPRPKWLPWIQKLVFKPFDFNYYFDDKTKKMQSLWTEFRPLGFTTKSGEFSEFNIQRKGENLTRDFEIHDGIVIPKGEYWFTDWELQFETFDGRKLYGAVFVNWGGFYNGKRTVWQGELTWQANRHIRFSGDYTMHDITLPEGSFVVHELGGRVNFAVNPNLFGTLFGQWNNEDKEILINFRVNWIPKPGTNFYFVVNQLYDTSESHWRGKSTTVQGKLIWRFVM